MAGLWSLKNLIQGWRNQAGKEVQDYARPVRRRLLAAGWLGLILVRNQIPQAAEQLEPLCHKW